MERNDPKEHQISIKIPSIQQKNGRKSPDDVIQKVKSMSSRLSHQNGWSIDVEKEILNYADICKYDYNEFINKSKLYRRTGNCLQFGIIISSALNVFISGLSSMEDSTKLAISGTFGIITTVLGCVYNIASIGKKSIIYDEISNGILSLHNALRMETMKTLENRNDPMEILVFAEETREKLFQKIRK